MVRLGLLSFWLMLVLWVGVVRQKNIFLVTPLETIAFNTSRGYLPSPIIARAVYNKLNFYTSRYLINFFAGIDHNYFFFGGHPREIPGGNNEMKISYWLLPFFLLGVYEQLLVKEIKVVGGYLLTLAIVSFFAIDSLWFFLVPFWYVTAIYPLKTIWKE